MVKTPEEYFAAQRFDDMPQHAQGGPMSAAEQAFIQKYVGEDCIEKLGLSTDGAVAKVEPIDTEPLQVQLAAAVSVQMIFFELAGQVYCIPIDAVQEVIRYIPPTSLPLAPVHVAGIINLRGRVTPLIALDNLLGNIQGLDTTHNNAEKFIIVCVRRGLQVGLIVERIQNMITIKQEQILWNVESQLGANTEYICGIVEYREKVFGIASIDMIVDYIIKN